MLLEWSMLLECCPKNSQFFSVTEPVTELQLVSASQQLWISLNC